MRTAFVTGAAGFVGLNLVERLVEEGWRVVALHRLTSDLTYLRRFAVDLVEGTLSDAQALARLMPEGCDAVFHVAGNTTFWSPRHAEQARDNVEGTRNVVDAALRRQARRLLYTSSLAAFGHHRDRVTESTPSNASSSKINYVRTKWLAEAEVRKGIALGLEAVILNPAHILGAYDLHNWSRVFGLLARHALPGVPPGVASFCHAREVARAHVAAVDRGRSGESYLLGGADASFEEMAGIVAELIGEKPPRRVPAWVLAAVAQANYLVSRVTGREPDLTPEGAAMTSGTMLCDSGKAERELAYTPVPLATMLADCHRWLREERRLAA